MLALVRAQQACRTRSYVVSQVARSFPARRALHQTPVAMKKKKRNSGGDDMFADDADSLFGDSGDLFSTGQPTPAKSTPPAQPTNASTSKMKGKLSPEKRLEKFNALLQLVSDHTGVNPPARVAHKPEQVRKTAWQNLFGLAANEEQLLQVTELFPKWRESRREFTPRMAEAFVRRCQELGCPTLALKVFADHPKYGFDLTSPQAARSLLHALHTKHPLEDTITLSALYGAYKLPAISSDLVSCAMLTSACFKANTPESLTVADALVPSLQKMLAKTNPKKMEYPTDPAKRVQLKERAWLTWTLTKIEKALSKQDKPMDWLRKWREASGHAQIAT